MRPRQTRMTPACFVSWDYCIVTRAASEPQARGATWRDRCALNKCSCARDLSALVRRPACRHRERTMAHPPAVERDLQAFWRDPARVEKFKKDAMTHGWFVTLEQAQIKGDVGPALFAFEYRRYYGQTLDKVR